MANDGSIKIGIDLDTANLEKDLQNVKKNNRKTYEEMARDTGKSVEQIEKEVKKIAEEYQKQGDIIPLSYKKAYRDLGLKARSNANEVSSQANKIGNAYKNVGLHIGDSFKKGFAGISNFAKTSITAIAGVTASVGGLGVAIGKVGMDFEAQMSRVGAISGSTTEELELLEAKAKEMGATTQFSATESAQALEYMALAGWKTEDMLGGLSGVMNLAAASGEDLAMVSDIVTDGLSAFGLTASDSSKFADVLAAASSNANTNVAMLGESFKYVAPVAGALGYSIEDTSVALGLMANAGIKASQSGTSLRTLMTNLASPSTTTAKAINNLGLSITDASGNMLPFNDVILKLRDSFSTLGEAEKAQYAEMLAGKEGMSGLLAIVNASQADFDKLSGAINNSTGSAEQMAKTMNDNLSGSLKVLKSTLEGIALSLYEELQTPLKDITKYITEMLSNLQQAFNEGGIDGLISALGDAIGKLLTDIAAKAPQMLQIGINIIQSLLNGIKNNSSAIGESAATILTTLINGIITLLPDLVNVGADLIINFQQGLINNLPMLLESGKQMLENISTSIIENLPLIVENAVEIIMQLVNGLIDNLPLIIDTAIEIILSLADGLVSALPELMPACIEAIMTIAEGLLDNIDKIIDSAIDLIVALADGLIQALPVLIEKVPVIITKLVSALIQPTMLIKLINVGMQLILSLIEGIIKSAISVGQAAWDIGETIVNKILEFPKQMFNAGIDLIRGLIEGIKSMGSAVFNTLKDFCSGIVDNVKGFFGIHSPSRVFKNDIGIWLPMGMAEGIASKSNKVVEALVQPLYDSQKIIDKESNILSKNLVATIVGSVKKIKLANKNFGEIGDTLINSLTENIDKNKQNAIDSISDLVNEMVKEANDKIDTKNNKLIENYTNSINKKIENNYISKEAGKKLITDYTKSINKAANENKENIKNVGTELMNIFKNSLKEGADKANELIKEKLSTLTQNFQNEMDSLKKAQESLEKSLAGTKLFEFDEDNNLIIENLDATINKLDEYDKAISKLKEKGISDAILNELSSYSVDEALKISEKLLKMTDEEFDTLNKKWEEKQNKATEVASNFYKEQMEILEKEFNEKLLETLNELPDEVESIGLMTIAGFEDGLTSKMDSIKDDVRAFADNVVSEMQRALDIHSPSRKMKWLGQMTMEGYDEGISKSSKGVLSNIKNLPILETFKSKVGYVKNVVSNAMNSMVPKSSNTSTDNPIQNITNNSSDVNIYVDKMEIREENDINRIAQEIATLINSRNLAKGIT